MDIKKIDVPLLPRLHKDSPLRLVAEALDALPRQQIAEEPWPGAQEKPTVGFAIGYNGDCIFLRYYVQERTVRARYLNTNDPVYKDSCVEFFISFNGGQAYYNLEFNRLGTCLAGFGHDRHDRRLLPEQAVSQIRRWGTMGEVDAGTKRAAWQLTLVIPAEVFTEHRFSDFRGTTARANFYKCGDDLPEPHFLAWNRIQAPQPDFHLPAFFGELRFT